MISQPLANIHFEGRKGKDEEIRNDHFLERIMGVPRSLSLLLAIKTQKAEEGERRPPPLLPKGRWEGRQAKELRETRVGVQVVFSHRRGGAASGTGSTTAPGSQAVQPGGEGLQRRWGHPQFLGGRHTKSQRPWVALLPGGQREFSREETSQ